MNTPEEVDMQLDLVIQLLQGIDAQNSNENLTPRGVEKNVLSPKNISRA